MQLKQLNVLPEHTVDLATVEPLTFKEFFDILKEYPDAKLTIHGQQVTPYAPVVWNNWEGDAQPALIVTDTQLTPMQLRSHLYAVLLGKEHRRLCGRKVLFHEHQFVRLVRAQADRDSHLVYDYRFHTDRNELEFLTVRTSTKLN